MHSSPAFGQADLTNCERELIHLAGSIQPHGLLLVLREPALRIVQASVTAGELLQRPLDALLQGGLGEIGGDLDGGLRALLAAGTLDEPQPLRCTVPGADGPLHLEGAAHRVAADTVVVELEPATPAAVAGAVPPWDNARLLEHLGAAVQRFSEATSIGTLADQVVRCVRELAGYDRVMVYQFDPDGHGKIIAEARDPRLESLLGHHYPATDIPQRARDLYVRNRVRVLVDVNYEPSPLVPRLLPGSDEGDVELDMSMCFLRSMSPLHLQYLRNMGVTATLVVSLVREGRLWGLIACHHDTPRHVGHAVRTAAELLAEAIATRIAAIEHYARAQVAIQVRRLEQRLIEATASEGDWRLALVRDPRMLQQPLDATGAALFHDGELLTSGEVPSTPELRALMRWIDERSVGSGPVATSALGKDNPALASLTPTASGVLAVKLSAQRPDYLVWFRKEQLQSVTWAGDPTKPMIDNDPLKLSPRRSFAAWSEIVRGTAAPWTASDLATAAAFGDALVDIIVQVNAVRMLIAEHQLAQVRAAVADSKEAVAVAGGDGRMFYANAAFCRLAGRGAPDCGSLETLSAMFTEPAVVQRIIGQVRAEQRTWRGELTLARPDGASLPVAVRGEPVPTRDGSLLGVIFLFNDLSDRKRADAARQRLESALSRTVRGREPVDPHDVVAAIIANASLAAMDIADGGAMPAVAPLLDEVEAATSRAARLYARIRAFARPRD